MTTLEPRFTSLVAAALFTCGACGTGDDVPNGNDALGPDAHAGVSAPGERPSDGAAPTECTAQAACTGKCGTLKNRCGASVDCGGCKPGETCGAGGSANVCGAGTCTPSCNAKMCGDSDGCAATCQEGPCAGGQRCVAGACVAERGLMAGRPGYVQSQGMWSWDGESTSHTQSGASVKKAVRGASGSRARRQPARSGTRTSAAT